MSSLSGGQRRRLDVAMGLVHSPSLLFLDEPSTGLDPQNRANLWQHILQMRDRAATPMTIVLTTHYLDEADSMAGRVVVVDHGEVIADDTAEALKADLAGDRIDVSLEVATSRAADLARLVGGSGPPGTSRWTPAVTARIADGPRALPALLRAADARRLRVATAQLHRPTLDDVFLTLTGRSLREAGSARPGGSAGSGRPGEAPDGPPQRPRWGRRHEHRDLPDFSDRRPDLRRGRGVLADSRLVMVRELRPVLRDPFSLVFGMIQPLVFLALFGPLLVGSLGGQADAALGGSVWQWFVPSILVMTALFGTSTVGANLIGEFQSGAHERMLVTPLSRPSLLIGRALKEMLPVAAQAVLIVAVMIPFGFTLHPVGALVGLLLLGVFGIGLGSLSYALAIAVRRSEWMFWAVQQTLIFPLMILSGLLLPLQSGPAWMQVASKFNPLTYLVDAERALFAGDVGSAAGRRGVGGRPGCRRGRAAGRDPGDAGQRRLIGSRVPRQQGLSAGKSLLT